MMKTNLEEIIKKGLYKPVNFTEIDNSTYKVEWMGFWVEMTIDDVIEYLDDIKTYQLDGIYGVLQRIIVERVRLDMKIKEDK